MTLLGKLFRPWDLPKETGFETDFLPAHHQEIKKVSKNERTGEGADRHSRRRRPSATIVTPRHDSNQVELTSSVYRCSGPAKVPIPKFDLPHLRSELKDERRLVKNENLKEFPDSPAASTSCSEPMTPTDLSDFHHFSPNFSSSNNLSNIFLYPNTINDLANLSKSELTVMGLLPLDPSSNHKGKRQRPKRFHCPHCQVAFSNNGQLKGHIRIHTGRLL